MDEVEYAHMMKMRSLRFNKFSKILDTAMNGSDASRKVIICVLDELLQSNKINDKTITEFLYLVDMQYDIGVHRVNYRDVHTFTVDEKDYKHYQEWINNKESE
tara:strand:+ start:366 stop:674 length:309 start_codon:yes stop_codon:yes gene_type:complete